MCTWSRWTGLSLAMCAAVGCSEGSDRNQIDSAVGSGGIQAPAAGANPVAGMPAMGGVAGGTTMPMSGGAGALSPGAIGGTGTAAGMGGGSTVAGTGAGTGGDDMIAGMGGGTTLPPGPDGLPRADEVNVDQMGPYSFESFTEGTDNATYGSAVMYYPTDATPPFASVVFSPGFTATKESYMDFLGPLLASHGIAILLTTPTTTGDLPNQRGTDLAAAIEQVAALNEMSGSPVQGKMAIDRVCVTGHSMGGGGSLWAANDLGEGLRCVVPLQPWQPGQSFSSIASPTMFITGQSDAVAGNSSNSRIHYGSIPDSVAKYYVEFAGGSHYLTTNTRGTNYAVQSRYMIAFYKVYAEDDIRYLDFLNAPADPELSDYQKSQ